MSSYISRLTSMPCFWAASPSSRIRSMARSRSAGSSTWPSASQNQVALFWASVVACMKPVLTTLTPKLGAISMKRWASRRFCSPLSTSTTELRVMEMDARDMPSPSSTLRNSSRRSSLSLASGSQASVGSIWSTPSSLTWRSWEAQTVEGASRVGVPSGVVLPNESMLAPIGQFSAVNIVVPSMSRSRHGDPIGSMGQRGSGSLPDLELLRGAQPPHEQLASGGIILVARAAQDARARSVHVPDRGRGDGFHVAVGDGAGDLLVLTDRILDVRAAIHGVLEPHPQQGARGGQDLREQLVAADQGQFAMEGDVGLDVALGIIDRLPLALDQLEQVLGLLVRAMGGGQLRGAALEGGAHDGQLGGAVLIQQQGPRQGAGQQLGGARAQIGAGPCPGVDDAEHLERRDRLPHRAASYAQALGQGPLPREPVAGAHALAQQQIQEAERHGAAGGTADADRSAGRAGFDLIGAEREDRAPTTFRRLRLGRGCGVHSSHRTGREAACRPQTGQPVDQSGGSCLWCSRRIGTGQAPSRTSLGRGSRDRSPRLRDHAAQPAPDQTTATHTTEIGRASC